MRTFFNKGQVRPSRQRKAGHRRWGARGSKVPGRHRGDIMSVEARSALMSKIQGQNTAPELAIAAGLQSRKLLCERHCRDLPGRPDFVFRSAKLAVFVDGD